MASSGGNMSPVDSGWVLVGGKSNVEHLLPPTMIFLGREECDVILMSQSVDKRHAVITYDHYLHRFKVKDLNSSNGTFVNNSRIPEQTYVKLNHLDMLRFGYDTSIYHIREPQKVPMAEEIDVAAKRRQSPIKTPPMSPSSGSDQSSCKGCLQEKLATRQGSPTCSLPESSSPLLYSLLHISEESLSRDVKWEDNPQKTTNELSDHCKVGSVSSSSSCGVSSPPESEVSFLSTSNDESCSGRKTDFEAKIINQSDPSSDCKSSSASIPNRPKYVHLEGATNDVKATRRGSESDQSMIKTSTNDNLCLAQFPVSTAQPINFNQPQINKPGPVPNQPLFSSSHAPNLMSASYPSPGISASSSQPTLPIHLASTHEPYNPGYANPVNCYPQVALYPSPAYQPSAVGTNVLQPMADLARCNIYEPMPGTCHLPKSGDAWPDPTSANLLPNIQPAQSIISNISGDSLDSNNLNIDGGSMPPVNASSCADSLVIKAKSSQPVKNSEEQMTPLYGQPAWWGDSDPPETPEASRVGMKSAESNPAHSSATSPSISTPVATAFTIDFDIPKSSGPSKKLAIKDSLKKFAPHKPNSEETRGHRRSSSQNIVVENEAFPKEEVKKTAKTPLKAIHKTSISKGKSHQSHPNADHKLEKSNKRSEASNKVAPKIASNKINDHHLDSAPMSQSYPTPTQITESAAYLIEKMLNPDSVKQNMMQKTKGCSDDRIRRKTVILSPKDDSVIDRRQTVVLSPKEEEIPDNISETGTYILDADKPDAEVQAARDNIEKSFGLVNGENKFHDKIVVKEDRHEKDIDIGHKSNYEVSRPPVAPPRMRNKVGEKHPLESLPAHNSSSEAPRHRRKLPTPPVDQSPLNIKAAFSPKLNGVSKIMGLNQNGNSDIPYDTKKILKDTENVVTAMQARIRSKNFGHSSPMIAHMAGSSSSDSDLDVSSASLASDSALFNRQKKFMNSASRRRYTSDDGMRNQDFLPHKQKTSVRPHSAGVQTLRIGRPSSVQSNSSESSDTSRKKKSPPVDLSLKVNRAFELRKARTDDDHTSTKTQSKARPENTAVSRSIQPSASSSRLSENFNRSDGGRFSLRVKSAPPRKQKGPTKKELEMAAWTRRKAYNPLKAAAQGKKKSSPRMDDSFYTDDEISTPLPSNDFERNGDSPTIRQASQQLEALDVLVISSIHQLSCRLKNKSQEILCKARDNCYEEKEKSSLQDVIAQLNFAESPAGNSTRELSAILKNLKRVELGLDVLNKSSCMDDQANKVEEYY